MDDRIARGSKCQAPVEGPLPRVTFAWSTRLHVAKQRCITGDAGGQSPRSRDPQNEHLENKPPVLHQAVNDGYGRMKVQRRIVNFELINVN